MKVAVASSDGKMVNQHFGHSRDFLIFEIDGEAITFLEHRKGQPVCSPENPDSEALFRQAVSLLRDCQAVLCERIGFGVRDRLKMEGIEPVEAPDFIDNALRDYARSTLRSP